MKKSFIHQQQEISFVKNTFTQYLIDKLEIVEVQGPILSQVGDGMQDNLNGQITILKSNLESLAISIGDLIIPYVKKVVEKIKDPVVKKFWTHEYDKMAPNQKVEAAWPILNKVWQFLSTPILRNVLGQPKNSFSLRWAMDNQKIVIIKLSK